MRRVAVFRLMTIFVIAGTAASALTNGIEQRRVDTIASSVTTERVAGPMLTLPNAARVVGVAADGPLPTPVPTPSIEDLFAAYDWGTVPLALVLRIADCESGMRPDIVSPTGDYGLMQINKSAHRSRVEAWYGTWEAILDPATNLDYASFLARDQGVMPWRNSAGCW